MLKYESRFPLQTDFRLKGREKSRPFSLLPHILGSRMTRVQEVVIVDEPENESWRQTADLIAKALANARNEPLAYPIAVRRTATVAAEHPSCFIVHRSSRSWEVIAGQIPNSCWLFLSGGAGEQPLPTELHAVSLPSVYGREHNFENWLVAWATAAFELDAFRTVASQLTNPTSNTLVAAATNLRSVLKSVQAVISGAIAVRPRASEESLVEWVKEGVAIAVETVDRRRLSEDRIFIEFGLHDDNVRARLCSLLDPVGWVFGGDLRDDSLDTLDMEIQSALASLSAIASRHRTIAVRPLEQQVEYVIWALSEFRAALIAGEDSPQSARLLGSEWARTTVAAAVTSVFRSLDRSRWLIRTLVDPKQGDTSWLFRLIRSHPSRDGDVQNAVEDAERAIRNLSTLLKLRQTLSEFATLIHDLNAILMAIVGPMELLKRNVPESRRAVARAHLRRCIRSLRERTFNTSLAVGYLQRHSGLSVDLDFIRDAADGLRSGNELANYVLAIASGAESYEDALCCFRRMSKFTQQANRLIHTGAFIDIDSSIAGQEV